MAKSALRPLALKVGYLSFRVEYVTDYEWQKRTDLDDSDSGQMQGYTATISVRVYDGQDEDVTREVLLHELLHAIFYVTSLTTKNPKLMDDWEEETIQAVSPTLLGVFKDNPELSDFINDVS